MATVSTVLIDANLVRRLIASQFPQWADLRIEPVATDGWDNRTFHLGDQMTVRLPRAEHYAGQVEKEHRWLPKLAPFLPLPIPEPLAKGEPAHGYPWPWSVYGWLEGDTSSIGSIGNLRDFATTLADFLRALHRIEAREGPAPGPHNFYRGGALSTYDRDTRAALEALTGTIDTAATTKVWESALASTWQGAPVWVHGDVAPGNLLVQNGRLCAVIDFGCLGVGDPACDLAIAWTFFSGESRAAFRASLPLDDATWARGQGWTLWKALILLARPPNPKHPQPEENRRIIRDVIAEHVGERGR